MRGRSFWFLLFTAAFALWPARAHAMPQRRFPQPAGVGRPSVGVLAEEVRIACDAEPRCRLVARWRIAPEAHSIGFAVERGKVETITLDDVAVQWTTELRDGEAYADPSTPWPFASIVRVDVPEVARDRTLVATVLLHPLLGQPEHPFGTMVATRHRLLHDELLCTSVWYGAGDSPRPATSSLVVERTRGLRRRAHTREDGLYTIPICTGRSWHGGPLVGIGAGFEPRARLRLRAAYELSSHAILVHGLAIESDLRQVIAIPYTDVGTGNIFLVIPSVALGVGVPMRVWPDFRAGVRAQLTISWPYFGIVGAFDALPRVRDEPTAYYGVVMAQFGF